MNCEPNSLAWIAGPMPSATEPDLIGLVVKLTTETVTDCGALPAWVLATPITVVAKVGPFRSEPFAIRAIADELLRPIKGLPVAEGERISKELETQ